MNGADSYGYVCKAIGADTGPTSKEKGNGDSQRSLYSGVRLVFLLSEASDDIQKIGGKAKHLVWLSRAGFPVPEAFIITTDAYREFKQNGFPDRLSQEIEEAYHKLSLKTVAVRSSATAEDLPGFSFAGQYDTVLSVEGLPAIINAVKQCWNSLWSPRAVAYRQKSGIDETKISMAVIVQRMVAADFSGVAFSANPITGHRGEVVVNAIQGTGEAVVSGRVNSDLYIIESASSEVVKMKESFQLPNEKILRLARMARQVESHFGAPQDIEWSIEGDRIYLLQSRPITSLFPVPVPKKENCVYYNFNLSEGMTGPFTPLGLDIMRSYLEINLRRGGGITPETGDIAEAGGRLFINVAVADCGALDSVVKQILIRLEEKQKKAVPMRTSSRSWRFRNYWRTIFAMLPARIAPCFWRRRIERRAERFLSRVEKESDRFNNLDEIKTAVVNDFRVFFNFLADEMDPMGILSRQTLQEIHETLTKRLNLASAPAADFVKSTPGNPTTQMNLELWEITEQIRANPEMTEIFRNESIESLVDRYRKKSFDSKIQSGMETFLERFGFRSVAELDLGHSRWHEDPAPVFQSIKTFLDANPDWNPKRIYQENAEKVLHKAGEYEKLIRTKGKFASFVFRRRFRRYRELARFRELPRFYLARLLDQYRNVFLKYGERLAMAGKLEKSDDIFWLSFEKLNSEDGLKPVVVQNRIQFDLETRRKKAPNVLLSTGEVFYGLLPTDSILLTGLGASPGIVEGTVRIVLDSNQEKISPGEILVCAAVDPGWTPLLMTASGLIMETGGLLSHGCVIAREYGIPAITAVPQATQRLRSGQRVRLDGGHGQIEIL